MNDIKYGKIIKHLSDSLEKKINNLLKIEDLSMTQGLLIRVLSEEENKELPIKVIEKKFGVAQSTIYGVVSRLENKGLVLTYSTDRNSKWVRLTERGSSKVTFILSSIKTIEDELFTGFGEDEKRLFTDLLIRAEYNLQQSKDTYTSEKN